MAQIIEVTGRDARKLLQGLVTNDVERIDRGPVYAALLTPQGKYLADFLMLARGEAVWLDTHDALADGLAQRLGMYRLRSDAAISVIDIPVARGVGPAPEGALPDPRHEALGWRLYGQEAADGADWDAIRVEHLIPEAGRS